MKATSVLLDGIGKNNVSFVQFLGMCPLMAVTTSATNGFGMGVLTALVIMASNLIVSLVRNIVPNQVRIPIFTLTIAALVTIADLFMNAWMHDLHKILGLFIALIVANCAVLGRAEAFAMRNNPFLSVVDGLGIGAGFTLSLTVMGACREIIGSGTLFAGAAQLLGPHFKFLEMHVLPGYHGFLLMLLPPGGFLMMGFLLCGLRLWKRYVQRESLAAMAAAEPQGGCH